jgi:hypothetical protein
MITVKITDLGEDRARIHYAGTRDGVLIREYYVVDGVVFSGSISEGDNPEAAVWLPHAILAEGSSDFLRVQDGQSFMDVLREDTMKALQRLNAKREED